MTVVLALTAFFIAGFLAGAGLALLPMPASVFAALWAGLFAGVGAMALVRA